MTDLTTSATMPAAFIGHGDPMNALELIRYTLAWRAFGESVPTPRRLPEGCQPNTGQEVLKAVSVATGCGTDARRLLWGSDWPHVYEYGPYEESLQSLAAAFGILRAAEGDLIFGGTARSLYGFRS